MLDTKSFITTIRTMLETILDKVYSPDLPQEKTNVACVTMLGGTPNNNLCGLSDAVITFRVLIRGTNNDTKSRELSDKVFNLLHLASNIKVGKHNIIQILAETTPVFVGKDENQNNVYNITFKAILS